MSVENPFDPCHCDYDYSCNLCTMPSRWPVWLSLNLETAAAMEITRQSAYRRGFENAMAIKGICEPLEEEHAQRILARGIS